MKRTTYRSYWTRFAALLACATLLSLGMRAQAGQQTVLTQFNTAGATLGGLSSNGGSVSLNVTSSPYGVNNVSTAAGAFLTQTYDASGTTVVSSFLSFCVDLQNGVGSSPTIANVNSISSNPDTRNLVGAGWVLNRINSAGINSFLSGTTNANSAAKSAGAQLAIWAVSFSTNPTAGGPNFGPGFSVSTNSNTNMADYNNAVRIANNLISDWINGGRLGATTGLIDYKPLISGTPPPNAQNGQDQIYLSSVQVAVVPEPSTIVMLVSAGAFGLVGLVRKRMRTRA